MGEYRSRIHKARASLFSQGGFSLSLNCISLSPAVYGGDSPLSPPPPSISLFSPSLNLPPSFSPLCCRVTACRCCVRGVQLALCGLSVWSHSVERLLTGWMRESKTVYFNLFRMPELCPEFLLNLIP